MSATLKPKVLFIGFGHLAKSLLSKKLLNFVNIHALNSKGVIKNINSKKKILNFNNDYKYIKTIGVSLFREKTSTSRHFGPLRMTYRILYNFNKVNKEGSYIEADGRINKWKYEPLFIFDDTLIHQSFNEEENLRYCAFIDIIRPSHFDNVMKSILTGVGFLLKKTRSIFYKNWKMI